HEDVRQVSCAGWNHRRRAGGFAAFAFYECDLPILVDRDAIESLQAVAIADLHGRIFSDAAGFEPREAGPTVVDDVIFFSLHHVAVVELYYDRAGHHAVRHDARDEDLLQMRSAHPFHRFV